MLHVCENSRGKQAIQNYLIHCFTNKKMNLWGHIHTVDIQQPNNNQ